MSKAFAVVLLLSLLNCSAAYSACRELDVARTWLKLAYAATVDVTIEFFRP